MATSRRNMVKALGMLAGASLMGVLPKTASARSHHFLPEKSNILGKKGKVQAILLGADWRGSRFVKYSRQHPQDFSIIALADADSRRNRNLSSQLNLPDSHRFEDWKHVFEHPKFADVVIITLPGDFSDVVTSAIQAGYEVWVDQPASLNPSRVKAVNGQARSSGRELLYVFGFPEQLCFMPHHHIQGRVPEPVQP